VRKAIGSMAAAVMVLASSLASGSQLLAGVTQREVHYSDLNLSNRADAVTLYKRIYHAAGVVCDLPRHWDETGARTHACVVAAIARSVNDVNAPELTRYYESRHRKWRWLGIAQGQAAR
jgi:UrcA family protein